MPLFVIVNRCMKMSHISVVCQLRDISYCFVALTAQVWIEDPSVEPVVVGVVKGVSSHPSPTAGLIRTTTENDEVGEDGEA